MNDVGSMNVKKIKIGISQRIVNEKNYVERRDAISHDWSNLLEKIDFIPVFIPNSLSDTTSFLESFGLSGMILSGGDDLGIHPDRDKTELECLKFAIAKKVPLLGVCRGMQLINNFFGGSVVQNDNNKHVGNNHAIKILDPNISSILRTDSIIVNSYHNNLITGDVLASELTSVAIDETDNSIECLLHEKYPILGVMWHPERNPDENNKTILQYFFNELTHDK